MKVTLKKSNALLIEATDDKEKYKNESALYYAVKKKLNDAGLDVIKKNPQKDGHLTGAPYYIRDRKERFAFYDNYYAIRLVHTQFNENRSVNFYLFLSDDSEEFPQDLRAKLENGF